jgi:lipoate-protein ligase A
MNMAVDEALLLTANKPVLRFYNWRQPSVSFGYFGRSSEVVAESPRREIVRRWTGGGIVLHGDDLTYSIILPRQHTPALPSPRATYVEIHNAIREALSVQMEVALADKDAPKVSDACFANAVTADVLLRGQKIAGAAQRRTRAGLLHQGSIQTELPQDFPATFATLLCERFEVVPMSADVLSRARMIADEKYGTDEWLHRR